MARKEKKGRTALDMLRALHRSIFDWSVGYNAGKHYMRGPGPRWHAKHAPTPSSEMPEWRLQQKVN